MYSIYSTAEKKGVPPCPFLIPPNLCKCALLPLISIYAKNRVSVTLINHVLHQHTLVDADIKLTVVKSMTSNIVYHTYFWKLASEFMKKQ